MTAVERTSQDERIPPLAAVPMPSRVRALPRNHVGYPIPFFAAIINGAPDFRVGNPDAYRACIDDQMCWVCGQRRRRDQAAFVIGPMCAVNRVSQDPPSHVECAEYAAKACPFMARPNMTRRHRGLPDNIGNSGIAIMRNPGACLVWVTPTWSTFNPGVGMENGVLFQLGEPTATSWWAYGRPATRAEVTESIESGLPLLDELCDLDPDPADSRRVLSWKHERARRYLPAEAAG